ncbi:ester cyclase [Phytohabitans kaempferiae]|uniref:Ester cyclase n=1 Tax=Phytohabitans kaempferiae TaxID=1620943 RepID=A0ABV6LWI6_9ACTN
MPTDHQATIKATFERFHHATNSGDLALIETTIDEIFEPDAVFHAPVPSDRTGPEAVKRVWATLLRAFPDIRVTIEDVITAGDKVVLRNTVTGTHRGDYNGLPATGKSVRYDEIFILRFASGRIVESWGVVDMLAQLRQLGAIPAPTQTSS